MPTNKIKNKILKGIKIRAEIVFLVSVCSLDAPTWLPTIMAIISGLVFLAIDYGTFLLREERIEKAVAEYVQDQ